MTFDISRRLASEALGTGMFVATVVGSGIMADRLPDDVAISLLGNTLATGAILVVLITLLGPISAHFNPVVSLVAAIKRDITWSEAAAYVVAQVVGGIVGTWIAHSMFDLSIVQVSETVRTGSHSGRRRPSQLSACCSRSSAA